MIGVIDYGAGNLQSVLNAFSLLKISADLVRDGNELMKFDKVILPGVGAFREAMKKLDERNFSESIRDFIKSGRPFLGICLGMQLLFEESDEFGLCSGLGLINGRVQKFDNTKFDRSLKIPHVGWNAMKFIKQTPINFGLKDSEFLYFVHSFHVVCDDSVVLGETEYGYEFVSAVCKDNIYGFQPHPEKSSEIGLKILENYGRL